LADAGKLPGEAVAPLLAHIDLPPGVAGGGVHPAGRGRVARAAERHAFATAAGGDPDALRHLAEAELLPAARAGDFDAFGEALHDFNRRPASRSRRRRAGRTRRRRGRRWSPTCGRAASAGWGRVRGGPAVFALAPDVDSAMSLVLRFRGRVPCFVTRTSAGHLVEEAG
jgi:hypothetical protein